MPVIAFSKFQINKVIVTLFFWVWNKNTTHVADKNFEMP